MINDSNDNTHQNMNTIPLGSLYPSIDKLIPILLPAVRQCSEILADEDLDERVFVQYIAVAASKAALKMIQAEQ